MVVSIAPAVRVAIGEAYGLPPGSIGVGKIIAGLRRLGFDYVFGELHIGTLYYPDGNCARLRGGICLAQNCLQSAA